MRCIIPCYASIVQMIGVYHVVFVIDGYMTDERFVMVDLSGL